MPGIINIHQERLILYAKEASQIFIKYHDKGIETSNEMTSNLEKYLEYLPGWHFLSVAWGYLVLQLSPLNKGSGK